MTRRGVYAEGDTTVSRTHVAEPATIPVLLSAHHVGSITSGLGPSRRFFFRFLPRCKKRKKRKDSGDHDDHDDSAHEEATKIKNVQRIQFGKYMIDTWYYSPFPQVRPPPPSRRRAAADGGQLLALCANRSTSDTARSTSASSR